MNVPLLFALLVIAPAAPRADSDQRLCHTGLRGSVQLAYKPYGNAVFGSDGLTCTTVKPSAEPSGRTAQPSTARGQLSSGPARTFNKVETGP